jgi:hypothetical protein
MRKWLLIAFSPVVLLAVVVWWEGKACQTATDQCATSNATNAQNDGLLPTLNANRKNSAGEHPKTPAETNESCYRSNSYLCRILAPANIPNIFLVLIGIGGIIAAVGTLNILERQTKATEDAAIATRDSVKTIITTERAWLTATLMRQATKFDDGQWYKTEPYTVALNDDEIRDGFKFGYKLRVNNFGRTGARITGFEHRYSRLAKGKTKLPANSGDVIASKNEERIISDKAIDLFFTKIDGYMARARIGIDHSDDTLVFHGWVKYRPIIDPSEDSFAEYCYVYSPENEILIRRDEYNTGR